MAAIRIHRIGARLTTGWLRVQPAISQRRWTWPLLLGVAGTVSIMHAMSVSKAPFFTFDLYYFSGLVERHGSYTDVAKVVQLAAAAHRPVDPEGAYGAPSLVALLFQPLSFLPLGLAHVVWMVLCITGLMAAMRQAAGERWYLWATALAVTPVFELAWSVGNASLLTTACLVYAFGAIRQNGQNNDRRAGIALAIAIAFKIYPAFALLALVATGRWRAFRSTVICLAVLGMVTVVALGPHGVIPALDATRRLGTFVHPGLQNISVAGVILQLSGSQVLAHIGLLVSFGCAALAVIAVRRAPAQIAFAVACLVMLLAQSMTWRHYAMIAILAPLAMKDLTAIHRVSRMRRVSYMRWVLILGTLLAAGDSLSPYGLETGISWWKLTLWHELGGSGLPVAPSILQTVGLALVACALVIMSIRTSSNISHPADSRPCQ